MNKLFHVHSFFLQSCDFFIVFSVITVNIFHHIMILRICRVSVSLNSMCSMNAGGTGEENQTAFPKFLPFPLGSETFKANLPVGGEGDYALHARAHLGD